MFVDFNILNQLGSPSINSNTFANRPSAGQVGRLFVSTDTFEIYRDNGTGWDLIGGPGSSTITGSGTANTFTIFTGTNSIGDSSYLTQGTNAINIGSANLNLQALPNSAGSGYYLGQLCGSDWWRIYGNMLAADQAEMVFEVGDNGLPISSNGQRFRFYYSDTGGGSGAKDVFIADYDNSTFNTNLIVSSANSLGVRTTTPGAALDVHSTADVGFQLNGSGATPSIFQTFLSAGVTQYQIGYNWNASADYRRFSIYDSIGAKEVIAIDQQSRFVGINYQYSTLTDQPGYTLDVEGTFRATDAAYLATNGTGRVGINTTSPGAKLNLVSTGATTADGIRLTFGSEARSHNIYSGIGTGRDLYIEPFRSISIITGGGIAEGIINLQAKEYISFFVGIPFVEKMRLHSNGNLTLNSLTDVGNNLYVNGTSRLDIVIVSSRNDVATSLDQDVIFGSNGSAGGIRPNESGHLFLQSRSSASRDIGFITGTTPTERFTITGTGQVQVKSKQLVIGNSSDDGLISSAFTTLTNLSTSDVSINLPANLSNGAFFNFILRNVDSDRAVFTIYQGSEQGVGYKYGHFAGANCSISETSEGVFEITNLGDGRTYTLTFSTSSYSATIKASSTATGATYVQILALGSTL